MAFRLTKISDQGSIPGVLCEYLCSSAADIEELPKFGIPGTQEDSDFDNRPCGYGSIAVICTGEVTEVYTLTPDNEWTKM